MTMAKLVCYNCGWAGNKSQLNIDPDWPTVLSCPKCDRLVNEICYTDKIDPVVYGAFTNDFEKEDWIRLMYAALDQSSLDISQIVDIQNCIYNITGISDTYKFNKYGMRVPAEKILEGEEDEFNTQ